MNLVKDERRCSCQNLKFRMANLFANEVSRLIESTSTQYN